MSPSCDRGHSGKLIITRATTVALLQTIAMCSTALHGITHTVAYSSPAFEQTQVYSTTEPGTGSNLSNHRRSQVVRVPNLPNSLSGFHQCLTAKVETGDLIVAGAWSLYKFKRPRVTSENHRGSQVAGAPSPVFTCYSVGSGNE